MISSTKNSPDFRFAFLVHPRVYQDIITTFPLTRFLPQALVKKIFLLIGPMVIGKVYGLRTAEGESVHGDIIVVPLVARDILSDKKKAALQVERSIRLAVKRGCKIVGLGSLTSPVVGGGTDVIGKYNIKITNGNALTVFMAFEGIKNICIKREVNLANAFVSVVGGTGSTGSAIAKLLVRDGRVKRILLVGRTQANLELEQKNLKESYPDCDVTISTNINTILDCDVVVVATSAEGAILGAQNLKYKAIVYDVTQPQNVAQSVLLERPDIVVVDGGISLLPEGVGYTTKMGLAKGESFSCLAETMILAQEKYAEDFSIGRVTLENIDTAGTLSKKYGFTRAPLRSFGKQLF